MANFRTLQAVSVTSSSDVVLETAVLVSRPLETVLWRSWSWSWSRRIQLNSTKLNPSLFKSCSRKAKKDTMQRTGQTI